MTSPKSMLLPKNERFRDNRLFYKKIAQISKLITVILALSFRSFEGKIVKNEKKKKKQRKTNTHATKKKKNQNYPFDLKFTTCFLFYHFNCNLKFTTQFCVASAHKQLKCIFLFYSINRSELSKKN